ncbi:MAG: MFS transporter [Acidimicrobiia bacterium]
MSTPADAGAGGLVVSSPAGRWVLVVAVVGSGVAFLDGTVVNAALPAIADEFDAGLSSLQWVLSAYLLTLGSLMVLGGSLGDLFGRRRVFIIGLVGFGTTSLACAVAPSASALIVARALQGAAGSCLVPGSLALIAASFRADQRGVAIGTWSGFTGISTAVGPFLGGWLIDAVSWRWVFLINVPVTAVAAVLAWRHVPESRDTRNDPRVDGPGALTLALGLAGLVYALIEAPAGAPVALTATAAAVAVASLTLFVVIEHRSARPMVPLGLFGDRQFRAANVVTLLVYAALGVGMFVVVLHLQNDLGYSALEAGASLLPVTVIMLALSRWAGGLGQRIGPRLPMTVGPLGVGAGMAILSRVAPGDGFLIGVLPGVAVLGLGLAVTVAPLTAAVLAAVPADQTGVGSAVNNAVARLASLLAIAVVPALAGLDEDFPGGYRAVLLTAAVLAAFASVPGALSIRRSAPVRPSTHVPEGPPCLAGCDETPALSGSGTHGRSRLP